MSDIERPYEDVNGNPCTLEEMLRVEPQWAASRFRFMETRIAELEAAVEQDKLPVLLQELMNNSTAYYSAIEAHHGFDAEDWAERAKAALIQTRKKEDSIAELQAALAKNMVMVNGQVYDSRDVEKMLREVASCYCDYLTRAYQYRVVDGVKCLDSSGWPQGYIPKELEWLIERGYAEQHPDHAELYRPVVNTQTSPTALEAAKKEAQR